MAKYHSWSFFIYRMSLGFTSLRVGKKYYLINDRERHDFLVIERLSDINFKLKDLHTLEIYELYDLVKYGKSKDYELWEF